MNDPYLHPHAAHRRDEPPLSVSDVPDDALPSHLLHSESDYVLAMLEELDDVIFSAVRGDARALEKAQQLWPQVVEAIGWELIEESREQYLRFAIDVSQREATNKTRTAEHAVAVLEIISLLATERR